MAIQNAVTLIALTILVAAFDYLVESKILLALAAWEILGVYFVMGLISGLVLRGGIMQRLLYVAISALVATVVVELVLGSDPAYPFVRFLFMLPVAGVLLLGALVGIVVERVLSRSKKKIGPQGT
jgi:hypothetical protein